MNSTYLFLSTTLFLFILNVAGQTSDLVHSSDTIRTDSLLQSLGDTQAHITIKDTLTNISVSNDSVSLVITPDSLSATTEKLLDTTFHTPDTLSLIAYPDSLTEPLPNLTDSLIAIVETDNITEIVAGKTPIQELNEVTLVVHVVDSITGYPLKANIIMSTINKKGKANGTGICNSNGYFTFKLTPNSHFEITVTFPEHAPITEEVNLSTIDNLEAIFKKEYKLKKFKVGDVVRLPNVHFKQGDFHLQREAYPVLDKLVNLMNENPQMAIKLKGHTDNTGSSVANLRLSQQRINEVRYYILRKGIKLSRLKGEGYGDTKPLVPNNSPENMEKNRRVEFEILRI